MAMGGGGEISREEERMGGTKSSGTGQDDFVPSLHWVAGEDLESTAWQEVFSLWLSARACP